MKNIGLYRYETKGVDDFTSDTGIKIRRAVNKPIRKLLEIGTKGNIIVEKYPELEKNTPYIFAASHSFCEEVSALLAMVDRSSYILIGSTDMLEHNPRIYFCWATGMVYVDRENPVSRKEAVPKMARVINSGSSIIMFPEGRLNNSENLPCQKLFYGAYAVAKETGAKVVPISTFNDPGSKDIYLAASEPVDLSKYDYSQKEEASIYLRDLLATLQYEQMEKHASRIKRAELGDDPRFDYMIERKNEYMTQKWTKDVFAEELYGFIDKNIVTNNQVREVYKNISFNHNNAFLAKDVIDYYNSVEEEEKYDFEKFMHENWNKPNERILRK